MAELATLFALSFAAATLVPLPSEASLFAYVHVYPDRAAVAVAVATVGNTAGGMTSYGIGRLIPPRNVSARAIEWLRRYGAAATALAWLPVLGDALCVAAGWLRMHWAAVLAFMAAGRLARYIVVASLA
ncbi:MAG TPA: DedA family protein [Burkholderiales bacterium]|jgi:membrane protein YqaA with SNARE-associated domain